MMLMIIEILKVSGIERGIISGFILVVMGGRLVIMLGVSEFMIYCKRLMMMG